jgi:hypothetical protein
MLLFALLSRDLWKSVSVSGPAILSTLIKSLKGGGIWKALAQALKACKILSLNLRRITE